jgi:hypothetical protein
MMVPLVPGIKVPTHILTHREADQKRGRTMKSGLTFLSNNDIILNRKTPPLRPMMSRDTPEPHQHYRRR